MAAAATHCLLPLFWCRAIRVPLRARATHSHRCQRSGDSPLFLIDLLAG